MIWGYRNILSRKNHKRKIDKINKVFELYQVFMHNFPSKTIPIFLYIYIYIYSSHIGVEVSKHFGPKISYKKN